MHANFHRNKEESQVKKSKKTSFYCKFHNFHVRGSSHVINTNSKHLRAQINSARRIKAREKSIERKLPIRTFDEETRLTASELLKVIKNKKAKEFKNGISAQLKGRSTYVSGHFNPHKAKKIYANQAQKEAAKYFIELMTDKFYSFRRSKITDLIPIRENVRNDEYKGSKMLRYKGGLSPLIDEAVRKRKKQVGSSWRDLH